MSKRFVLLVSLFCILLCSACGAQQSQQVSSSSSSSGYLMNNNLDVKQQPASSFQINVQSQAPTPTIAPTPTPTRAANTQVPTDIPITGIGADPYGSPPALTALEIQLTQKLFAVINSDRAARGLYAYTWNATLSGGARLHSWNMYHCGFSHTCPDGLNQCTRIANEGFAGYNDCGENIAQSGPYPSQWAEAYGIQESMVNEPPTGWHRIHLLSTTLKTVGVGVYVDPTGYTWFTEDFVG